MPIITGGYNTQEKLQSCRLLPLGLLKLDIFHNW